MAYCNRCGIWAYLNCFSWHSAKNVHMGCLSAKILHISVIMEETRSAGIFEVFPVHVQNKENIILHFKGSGLICTKVPFHLVFFNNLFSMCNCLVYKLDAFVSIKNFKWYIEIY